MRTVSHEVASEVFISSFAGGVARGTAEGVAGGTAVSAGTESIASRIWSGGCAGEETLDTTASGEEGTGISGVFSIETSPREEAPEVAPTPTVPLEANRIGP